VALLIGLLILAVLSIPLLISIRRSNELFSVKVSGGQVELRRGRAPQRLLDDIHDVVRQPPVGSASIRVVRDHNRPRAQIHGQLAPGQTQRLRNVVGAYSLARIKAGGRPARAGRPKRRRSRR
jgi:hypothetical protein